VVCWKSRARRQVGGAPQRTLYWPKMFELAKGDFGLHRKGVAVEDADGVLKDG
jgi:hypothetical protein